MTSVVTIEGETRSLTIEGGAPTISVDGSSALTVVSSPTIRIDVSAPSQTLLIEGSGGPPGADGATTPTFESVAKNLDASTATFVYAFDGTLTSVAYATDAGTVTKTLGYSLGRLVTITLSGAIPSGIDTVKTLVYAGDSLASVSYS